MDFDQLHTFDRVVRDGSFTRAAARLNVTQATVSMRIKALEDAVGGSLFLRGRNVRLTDVGISFLPYCRRMLGVMQEAREALKRAERGRVAIGTLSTMIMPLVSRALLRFQRRHAGVDGIVRDGRHTHVATMLHEREVDLAVMCWPNIDPLLTHVEPLFVLREDLPLVAAPAVAERIGEAPDMQEALRLAPRFLNLRWWQIAPARMTSLTLAAPSCVELPTEPGRYLVEAGEGIGFFVRSAVEASLAAGRLVEIRPADFEPLTRDIALVVQSRKSLEQEMLLDFALEIADEAARFGTILRRDLPPRPGI